MLREDLVVSRSLRGRENDVASLFRETLSMGRPLTGEIVCIDEYVEVNLGWFLEKGGHRGVVAYSRGEFAGYGLLVDDTASLDRWILRKSMRLLAALMREFFHGRLNEVSREFYGARIRDAVKIRSVRKSSLAGCPHVHINVREGYRSGRVAREIMRSIDTLCAERGISHWVGEINARRDARRVALTRFVGEIVDERPNVTLSVLWGEEVSRLTVVHTVPTHP